MEKRYRKTHKKGVKRNIDNTLDGQIKNKFNYKRQMACNLACMYELLDGMTGEYYKSELYHVNTSGVFNVYTIKDKRYTINFTAKLVNSKGKILRNKIITFKMILKI